MARMKLKLQLVRDGEVLFEMPLCPTDWPRQQLADELEAFEEDFQRFSKIFTALSHETRFGMMRRLIEEENRTMNFTDFMRDLELNPKIVWESAKKLREGGFVEKIERGKYRCSEVGQRRFILLSLAMRRLIQTLKEMENL